MNELYILIPVLVGIGLASLNFVQWILQVIHTVTEPAEYGYAICVVNLMR